MSETFIIVGAGHAAANVVSNLRTGGFNGNIQVIGEEESLPYQRPPLSKKFLSGEFDLNRLFIRAQQYYQDQEVETILSQRVTRIERPEKKIILNDDRSLSYDKLILTTGSRVRKLKLPGDELGNIFYLRNLSDAARIRDQLASCKNIVVCGGGYIGLEVAAMAVLMGKNVTVLEAESRILNRVVTTEVAGFFTEVHRQAGVDVRCNSAVNGFAGDGNVKKVMCSNGDELDADLVIVGVGVVPNVELAEAAGLEIDNGIAVDEYCVSSDTEIFAAGDCTSFVSPHYQKRIRLESVQNATGQAKTVAANLNGHHKPYNEVPWFWSDQYDIKLQILGLSESYENVITRGDPESRSFSVFYLRNNQIIAVNAINRPQEFMLSKALVANKTPVDPDQLKDDGISMKAIADKP